MKAPILLSVIFFLIIAIAANQFYFKLEMMPFIGALLLAIVVLFVVATFVGKANRKRKGIQGEPDAFIFPDKTAKKLKKMDLGIQYEASVISSALLMLGIVLFLIYFIFFTSSSWVMKGLIIFNSICGLGLMGGMLVTYYQQLVAYRESTKFLHQYANKKLPQQQPQEDLYPEGEYIDEQGNVYDDQYDGDANYPYDNTNERRNMR